MDGLSDRLTQPGRNCWRVETAQRFCFIAERFQCDAERFRFTAERRTNRDDY